MPSWSYLCAYSSVLLPFVCSKFEIIGKNKENSSWGKGKNVWKCDQLYAWANRYKDSIIIPSTPKGGQARVTSETSLFLGVMPYNSTIWRLRLLVSDSYDIHYVWKVMKNPKYKNNNMYDLSSPFVKDSHLFLLRKYELWVKHTSMLNMKWTHFKDTRTLISYRCKSLGKTRPSGIM